MWTYRKNNVYSVGGELYHFGVKGMKWKNHRYARDIYDRINKNLISLYDPQEQKIQETTQQQSNKTTSAEKPKTEQTISGNISAKPKRAPIKRKNIGRAFVSKIINRRK